MRSRPTSVFGRALATALLLELAARPAGAKEVAPIDLTWDAPDGGCPSADAVLAQVAAQADTPVDAKPGPGAPALRARATIRLDDGRYVLQLQTRGATGTEGERAFSGDTCEQVAEAAALVLALALQSEQEAAASPSRSGTLTGSEETSPASTDRLLHGALRASIEGSAGAVPSLSPGVALTGALTRGRLRAEVQLDGWLPRTTYDGPRSGTGGSVGLVDAGLRGCGRPLAGSWDVSLCAGLFVGDVFAESVGVRQSGNGSGWWGALMAGIWAGPKLTSTLALRGGIEGGPRLTAPSFVLDGYGTIFRSSPWEARASVGLEVRLP